MFRSIFITPPSRFGEDGGAGSRYRSFAPELRTWPPSWLAQTAALVPGSRLVDCDPQGIDQPALTALASNYELAFVFCTAPGLLHAVDCARALLAGVPHLLVGMIGPYAATMPGDVLASDRAISFVVRHEHDHTALALARGDEWHTIDGLSFRDKTGELLHTADRAPNDDWDSMPSVIPVYARDLDMTRYHVDYLLHPFASIQTGRGCSAKCSFCLWPQTIGGRRYRAKSPDRVVREVQEGMDLLPGTREWMLDDDTFTADRERARAIAAGLGGLGVTWSCTARAHTDADTLRALKAGGVRRIVVGFETGSQAMLNRIRKGITLEMSRAVVGRCREMGIQVHGCFMVGLPLETRETLLATEALVQDLALDSVQVEVAAAYPGTDLYNQAVECGWLDPRTAAKTNWRLASPALSFNEIDEAARRLSGLSGQQEAHQ